MNRNKSLSQKIADRHNPRSGAAALGAALGVLLVGIATRFGVDPTAVEGGAITAICSYAASFLPSPPTSDFE